MIETHIRQRFPSDHPHNIAYRQELIRVCEGFVSSGLADTNFVIELTSGHDSKFWSCISEAILADQLRENVFPDRRTVNEGPDFLVMDGEQKAWIEVICPEPRGIPSSWLNIDNDSTQFPYIEILLRWTASIKEKAEKLIGNRDGTVNGYLQTGVVAPEDAYIIAVNGCQLRNGPFPELFGISQFPFAAEAVFPIGPFQISINRESMEIAERGYQHRPFIINRNSAQVPTYTFLDPRFEPISAIWAVDVNGGYAFGNTEQMAVIHNPNASNPISQGLLPAQYEYLATLRNDNEYLLERIDHQDVFNRPGVRPFGD